jgi:hypothetical protein
VAEQVGYIIGMDIRRPETGGECVPQVVEMEIADPSLFDGLFKTDYQLTASSSRPLRVEDALVRGRVQRKTSSTCCLNR